MLSARRGRRLDRRRRQLGPAVGETRADARAHRQAGDRGDRPFVAIDEERVAAREDAVRVERFESNGGTVDACRDARPGDRERVAEAMTELSASERTAFVLRHYEGMCIEEVSRVLGCQPGAAKHSVFRAVQKLRRALEPLVSAAK